MTIIGMIMLKLATFCEVSQKPGCNLFTIVQFLCRSTVNVRLFFIDSCSNVYTFNYHSLSFSSNVMDARTFIN